MAFDGECEDQIIAKKGLSKNDFSKYGLHQRKRIRDAGVLATKRMVEEAEEIGADAVVNIHYASSAVMQGAAEVIAYGTAVRFVG